MAFLSELEEGLSGIDKSQIIVFDLETTSTDIDTCEITQIAIIDGRGKKLFESLIKPDADDWNKEAQRLTGITPAKVKHKPSFYEVQDKIQKIFHSASVLVGYNIKSFDVPIIQGYGIDTDGLAIYDVYYRSLDYIDTKGKKNKGEDHKLKSTAKHFGMRSFNEHDALGDCKAILDRNVNFSPAQQPANHGSFW